MSAMRRKVNTLKGTAALSRRFSRTLKRGKKSVVVVLYGELGAGKTTFVKGLAEALGVRGTVTSPTFVIEKIYLLKRQKFSKLVHIDAYRLGHARELEQLGFKELLNDPSNLIVIEWGEKVASILPKKFHRINFTFTDEKSRHIDITHG